MKTKHLIMAMAALATAGCSQNEITEQSLDANPAIGFNVYTGTQTRGTEIKTADIYTPGFGVMAVKGSSRYMTKRQVTSTDNGTTWTYPIPAYWPADGASLSFYSYAPYGETGITDTSFDDDATPEIDFEIQDAWADMVDIVAAKNENVTSNTSPVSVSLKHILTRLAFTANVSEDISSTGTTVHITSLKVVQANSAKFYKSATYNIATDTWSAQTGIAADYPIISTATQINSDGTSTNLTGADNYLFCIPVTSMTEGDVQLEVTYKTTVNTVESIKTVQFKVPASHFAQGTAYVYNFTISLGKIVFTGAVDTTWTSGSGNLVPVP